MGTEVLDAARVDPSEPEEDQVPVGTQHARLRDRVEKARKERVYWHTVSDMGLVLKCSPLPETRRKKIEKRWANKNSDDSDFMVSAEVVVTAVEAIYELPYPEWKDGDTDDSGNKILPTEPPAGFDSPPGFGDHELMDEFGVSNAAECVKAFFPAQGDVMGAARSIMVFSGYISPEATENIRGN